MMNGRLNSAVAVWLTLLMIGCGGSGNAIADEPGGSTDDQARARILTVVAQGGGAVTSSPSGIACGPKCQAAFVEGGVVTLTAEPSVDEVFDGWGGGVCSGSTPTCKIVIKVAQKIVAVFKKRTLPLDVSITGSGRLTSSPSGIDCGDDCRGAYAIGARVTLTAVSSNGSTFQSWGGACNGSASSCVVTMLGSKSVSATFSAAVAGLDGACRNFYPNGFRLVEGEVTVPWTSQPKPAKGVAKREASFDTCEVRVTDHRKDGVATFERNDYSRRQAFNTDNSRQLVYAYDGSWHLYDTGYRHLGPVDGMGGDAEPQWDAFDPDVVYHLPTNGIGMKLYRRNVATGAVTVVGDFASRLKARWPTANAAWTRSEGSPSADGRYWCFLVDDALWGGLGFFTWDKQTDRILGMRSLTVRPDSVSMSPTGNYCVVTATDTVAYARDLSSSRLVRSGAEHADIGLTATGDDAYVSVDYGNGYVFMKNLRTDVRTDLFPTYIDGTATAFHFSGKAFRKPGWFVMSSHGEYSSSGPYTQQWLHRKVMIVKMAANPTIFDLADTQVAYNGYWTEPQASANRDMTKMVWTSNWNVDTELDVDTYMVQVPASAVK